MIDIPTNIRELEELHEKKAGPKIAAEINTKRMYMILLKAQEMILQETPSKNEIIQLLLSLEHDILLLNDENNHIERDLFH